MIAPLKPPQPRTSDSQRRMRLARRAVANSLLPRPASRSAARPVAAWKAGLLVTWMVVVAVCYVTRLLGLWN